MQNRLIGLALALVVLALTKDPTWRLHADEQAPTPDARTVERIVQVMRDCRATDLDVFDSRSLAELTAWTEFAKYAAVASEDLSRYETLALNRMRGLAEQLNEAEAYRSLCLAGVLGDVRVVVANTHPDEALVRGELAWVPLIDGNGDYYGVGIPLLWEANQWRVGIHSDSFDIRLLGATSQSRRIQQKLLETMGYRVEPFDLDCPTLPPIASPVWDEKESVSRIDDLPQDRFVYDDEEQNRIGYLKRRANERYALGLERPSSPSALALQAEIEMYSAYFSNGPGVGTVGWREKIERAIGYARQAEQQGARLDNVADLIGFTGELYMTGQGAFPIDLGTAKELFDWEATIDVTPARTWRVRASAYGLFGQAPDCRASVRMLEPAVAENDWDAVQESAWILSDCPAHDQRDGLRAQALLAEYARRNDADGTWSGSASTPRIETVAACQRAREKASALNQPAPEHCQDDVPRFNPNGFMADAIAAKSQRGDEVVDKEYADLTRAWRIDQDNLQPIVDLRCALDE